MDIPTDSSLPINIYHSSICEYASNPSNCNFTEVQDIMPTDSLLAYSSFRLMIQRLQESTALLDMLLGLKRQSRATPFHDPRALKHSLAFMVQQPEPSEVLTSLLWLQGDCHSELNFWLETPDGCAWLQTEDGSDWLETQSGLDWLQTQGGLDWLQTGYLKLEHWPQAQGGLSQWLQSQSGLVWLQTQGGRDEWLQTQGGQEWLWTQEGLDWLQSQSGLDWLQTQGGRDEWLQAQGGQEWMWTQKGLDWLQSQGRLDWLQTQGGIDEWLETHWHDREEDWLQTQGGEKWLQTQGGLDWLQMEVEMVHDGWLQTQGGADWLHTQGGKDWLQTQGGKMWLPTQDFGDWLHTQGGKEWLQTKGGFSSYSAAQRLANLCDVSSIPGPKTPAPSSQVSSPIKLEHRAPPCYEGLCRFCKHSMGRKSIYFWCSEVCMSKLGLTSLGSSKTMG
jgi:hypothetical protein